MKKNSALYWTPRVFAILFNAFLAMFALDVFVPSEPALSVLLGLLMHLIPNAVLAALTVFAWRYERAGGVAFIITALGFTAFFRTYEQVVEFLILSIPLALIGSLFLIHGAMSHRSKLRRPGGIPIDTP